MKNFTNNFKQFTSRLSARWLIMALMMLVGTSSAWADYYITGNVIGNWEEGPNNRLKMTTHESDVVKAEVSKGGDFKIHYAATGWDVNWYKTIKKGTSTGATITGNDNGSNLNLSLQSGYSYPVTIYFDPYGDDESPYVWAIATTGGSGGDGTKIQLAGSFNDWGSSTDYCVSTNNSTCSFEKELAANDKYEFKIIIDGTWYSSGGSISVGGNKVTFYTDKGNSYFKAASDGIYTFNIDKDKKVWITYRAACTTPDAPSLSRVSDIVKCGTTTTTSGTLKITTVNDGSTYYYKNGTNGSDVQINFGNNNQFTVSSIGDYYVKEVNDCGASSSWSSKVTISETNNSVSISDITGPDYICSSSSADYSITAIDGVTYNWSINSDKFTLGTNGSNSVTVTANGTEQIQATLTITATKNECPTPNSKKINLIPLPTISTVSPTEGTVCSETTIGQLEKTLTITKSANSSTKWYKGGDEKSSSDIVEQGQYTIKAVSNTASCVSNSSVTYTVTGITNIPTALAIDINGRASASICGGTATINAKATGATSYSLYKGNGDLVETKDGNANGVSFTVSEANTYKVKATNNCGSTGYSSDVTLTVIDVPSKPSFVTSGEVTCAEKPVNPNLSSELASGEYLVWYDASEGGTNLGSNLTSSAEDVTKIYYAAVSNGACESAERTPYTVDVEADPIVDLTLTLVDGKGNSLPLNYTYCQGDDVNVKLTYNGGIYWGEPEWNSTLTAGDMNTSGLRYDALNKKGEGTYTISNLQASGTLQVALTMCGNEENNKAISNELSITVAPVPVIESVTASKTSANCYEYVTLTATTSNLTEGTIVKWYEGNTLVGSGDTYRFTKETAGTANIEARVQNTANCAPVVKAAPAIKFTAESGCTKPAVKQGGIVYLDPRNKFGNNESWTDASAWFAAAFIKTESNVKYSYWTTMYDDDGDGTFACEIPSGYSKVVLCRMNPAAGNNMVMNTKVKNDNHSNWTYRWNETGEITIPTTAKKYTITGWGTYNASNLDGNKTFRTVELNAGDIWVQDNAHFKIHAWSETNQNEGNWIRMVDANGDKIYHADVPTEFTHLVFGRFSSDPSTGYAEWEQTANLDITGGTRYVISKNGGYDVGVNAEGYWSWPDKSSTYALGVSTISAVIGADNTSIICNAQIFKTSCAPAIWYGFQYSKDGGDFVNVEVGNTYVTAGKEYTYTLSNLEKGTYRIRARVQYANKTAVHDEGFTVVIADQCEEGYDFAIGGTTVVVQACGGSRVLPAIELLSDNTPAGKTITWEYEWKNADGTAATNLDFTSGYATPTFIGIRSQSYKVRVIKKEGSDIKCVQTADYEVAYEDNSPKATITAKETVQVYETLVLQGQVNYSESFSWTVKEGDTDVTSRMLNDATILNPTFNTQVTGEYTVTLTADANLSCPAHSTTITINVLPPTEDCASSDLEIEYDFSGGVPTFFNDPNDIYYTYKTKDGACVYTTIGNDNKLYKDNPSFTINNLNESDYPITLYLVAGNKIHVNNVEARGYAKYTLTYADHSGKKVICSATGGNDDIDKNVTELICIGNEATRKLKDEKATIKVSTISNTVSDPIVTNSAATVEGTSTEATLSAYLEKTGCSVILSYGFQYIEQDAKPTSSADATNVPLRTAATIGKTFRTKITDLEQGTYWYRAYATNAAGKSGYTEWKSFTIITDGPYATLNCENAIEILSDGKVKVTVTNIGNAEVLKGSYGLTILNHGNVLAYSPQAVPAIAPNNGTQAFTTVLPINASNYNIIATLTYKGRTQTCNKKICVPQVGGTKDTIRYTIDASAVTDKCMLVFPTVNEAIDHLKSSKTGDARFVDIIGDGYILRQPVVMEVVYSTTPYTGNIRVTTTGGYESGQGHLIIPITNINNDGNEGNGKHKIDKDGNIVDGYNPLVIRAVNPNAMPALQHVAIRKSRSVTLKNLNIISSTVDKDNAIDIDNNNNSWVGNEIGKFKNAKVTVSNCKIKSTGFTCVHVSAVDKVYFDNNEITADLENEAVKNANTRCWGSSVKFIRSTNIKFIRNNFMGTHATSIWLQGVEKALFMNNVLWNNNKIEEDIFAMFRIVQQTSPEKPKNIGIYYNTLYLADNSANRSKHPKFNFLTLNSNDSSDKDDAIDHNGDFDTGSIEFMYNNCYSYDMQTPGRPDVPFKYVNGTPRSAWAGLCYNNFWCAKSGADFSFNGCGANNVYKVSVKENVCTTTATDPSSLVISGVGLNKGVKPTITLNAKGEGEVGQSGIALNNDAELYQDRTRDDVRPTNNDDPWTLGAYQQTESIATDSIVWQGGVSSEWDDRNNWIDAKTKNTLTCVNTLAENLKVIIPAPHSENYPAPDERGIVNYPILPKFDVRDARFGDELVNAGQGLEGDITLFADSIGMEYGASLRGVENLNGHYNEATMGFTAGRDKWILVGTVVKPFNDATDHSKGTRNVKSGDYFITGQTPHVYMHAAYMDGNTARWDAPFTSLEESLEVTDVMAINIPNQYGAGKLTSQAYYTYVKKDPTKINDHLVAKDYSFNGRFVNETALPNYTHLTQGDPILLNNSYPANIDPKVIEEEGLGTVLMYDYKAGSFCIDPQVDKEAVIKPQHGFIFIPAGDALTITSDMVVNGETTSRSAGVEMPILSLDLYNANSINGERSRVVVKLDELKDEGPAPLDVTKIFTDNSTTPELYIVMYDNQYQRIHISNTETIIPLGIRLKQSMNVSFQKFKAEGFDKVTLVDKVLNTEYDLLNTKEVITEELSAGDIEGRFFLNLKETEEDDFEEGDENVSTEIEENAAKSINILVASSNSVRVITDGVELESITVSDMAGRTMSYPVSGCFAEIELPVAQGVYMINVIGDTASRTEKVILK